MRWIKITSSHTTIAPAPEPDEMRHLPDHMIRSCRHPRRKPIREGDRDIRRHRACPCRPKPHLVMPQNTNPTGTSEITSISAAPANHPRKFQCASGLPVFGPYPKPARCQRQCHRRATNKAAGRDHHRITAHAPQGDFQRRYNGLQGPASWPPPRPFNVPINTSAGGPRRFNSAPPPDPDAPAQSNPNSTACPALSGPP